METKEVLSWIMFFSLIALALTFLALNWRKEDNRANEQKILLDAFIRKQNSNETLIANALGVLAARSTIVIFQDENGHLIVRSVQTMDPELVQKLVTREVVREEKAIAEELQ